MQNPRQTEGPPAVAVVGLGCWLPGAADADAWAKATTPALSEVGAHRLPAALRVDATPGAPDAVTTLRGGWVGPAPIAPYTDARWPLADLDPVFGDVVHVVRACLPAELDRQRTGLVLANLGLPTTAFVHRTARALLSRPPEALTGGTDADRWFNYAPARAAAELLDLGGGSEALDAACASGLYALHVACQRLQRGEVDCAVAAAVNRADPTYLLAGFSQLRALSGTGSSRPFDRGADGLLVGEGAVAVALMRLPDAVAAGHRIHAVIRGASFGNDGRKGNLLAPDRDGQLRTLRAAWRSACLDPGTVGYVECHATGTAKGDGAEIAALNDLFAEAAPPRPVTIASAKSLVGHTVTAAGLAGFVRAIAAVRDGILHPAVALDAPRDELRLSPHLRTVAARTPWPEGTPRLAGVSAFGFGGTDAHVIVEGWPTGPAPEVVGARIAEPPRTSSVLAVVAVAARVGHAEGPALLEALRSGRSLIEAPTDITRRDPAAGALVDAVEVDPSRWRIPPLELADLLPQQLLALSLATDAAEAAQLAPERTGVIVGMATDPQVGEAVVRLALLDDEPQLADIVHPVLTAQRVQGSLPNFVANRLNAQLDLRGPSYVVHAGDDSATVALQHAARWLDAGVVDAVVVGAVDLQGHLGAAAAHRTRHGDLSIGEGGVVWVVRRAADAHRDAQDVLAFVDPFCPPQGAPHHDVTGHVGAADSAVRWLYAMATGELETPTPWRPGDAALERRALAVPHSLAPIPASLHPVPASLQDRPFLGSWSTDAVPVPTPRPADLPAAGVHVGPPAADAGVPLAWPYAPEPIDPPRSPTPTTRKPLPPRAVLPSPPAATYTATSLPGQHANLSALATVVARSQGATTAAHARFMDQRLDALAQLEQVGAALSAAIEAHLGGVPVAALAAPSPPVHAPSEPLPVDVPRSFDRAALERHAAGRLSEVFGPSFTDLDGFEPRVRMPKAPLLLVSRVVSVEGDRGELGPSRCVTEYDLPLDAAWSSEGHAPPCVVVESGQADLFLVSFLGIDEHNRGERVYRLLDCDLCFDGPRPAPGETLRHDIRIDSFARLGDTILFYFHYDCATTDGRPVLSMRNGCAGFFTPTELATPKGVSPSPATDVAHHSPLPPWVSHPPAALDDAAVLALANGRFGEALGPAFAVADGATLTLPTSRWRLVHRVPVLSTSGGPHGLGEVVFEQDLSDDDWFNPCHFQGDPCMPGTLMYDGCLQAVQLWLLGLGVSAAYPDGRFDPLPGCAAKLRCRGQVVPGHRRLSYRAHITSAGVDPSPWAIATVVLSVDGVPVVRAEDVGVHVVGEAVEARPQSSELPIGVDRILEFSVGSAVRAFGERYADFDHPQARCARMPGPPLLQMSEVVDVQGAPNEIAAPRTVRIAYDVPRDAWFWRAQPGRSMPWAILLETALQPCGWITAWQAAGIDRPDLHFRNLGGTAVQHAEVWPTTGRLVTTATQTSVSASGGLQVQFFDIEVHAGDLHVLTVHTHFGYFSTTALSQQKGLPKVGEPLAQPAVDIALSGHPAMPRDDWRMLDRVTTADPQGGAAGLGVYSADKAVDPAEWFFTAHFWLDPVMPGSLGLEALMQLAAWVWHERCGPPSGHVQALPLGHEVAWTYRGQVRLPNARMQVEIEVCELDGRRIVCNGVLRADGLAIYTFERFGLQRVDAAAPPPYAQRRVASTPRVAALLDTFSVASDAGHGTVRLDPAEHRWLADHCPTVTVPAVPLAFVAEIAAEAALQLRPGTKVVGLPELSAERWLQTGSGPLDVVVVAVADGDTVAVSLAVHVHNERFPALSGPKVHMRAVVRLGESWAPIPDAVDPGELVETIDSREAYDGGGTFHGPVLQAMTQLQVGAAGAVATLQPRPDADLLGRADLRFVLDPLLLDAATHPMLSGQPERWSATIPQGKLAYPTGAEHVLFHGPRPTGPVTASLRCVRADSALLCFTVVLAGSAGPWCSYRWNEAVVDAGPALGQPAERRRAFLWDRTAVPEIRVGRPDGDGWQVRQDDLVEPLPSTILHQWSTPEEVAACHASPHPAADARQRLAVKERLREHLRSRLGHDVHPRQLVLRPLRPGRWVVGEAPTLTAQQFVDHLGPTRFELHSTDDGGCARAHITPGDGTGKPPFQRHAVNSS